MIPPRSLRRALLDEPARFSFDAAVGILWRAAGPEAGPHPVRFRAPPGLAFVPADVLAVVPDGDRYAMLTGHLSLAGPGGVLPRPYTEMVNAEQRRRSPALGAMLDVLAQRALTQFAAAGTKYRPHRAAEHAAICRAGGSASASVAPLVGLRGLLLALIGYATPGLAERLATGVEPLLFYAGAFASRVRSAERLGAILTDWMGWPVEVQQFVGSWLRLGCEQMSALPRAGETGRFNQLGVDAAAGARAYDVQSRIILRVGPVDLPTFAALLPGQDLLRNLSTLAAAYLDGAVSFAVNPVLAASAVPPLRLLPEAMSGEAPQLGRSAWLPIAIGRTRDATEAIFSGSAA